MQIHVITAFPSLFASPLNDSIVKRALDRGLVEIHIHDLREFARDKHHQVDDYPYGGGPGMVLKPEPIFLCSEHITKSHMLDSPPIIFMTPQGKQYTQTKAIEFAGYENLILVCGHYKGVDERVRKVLITEEISIGDYILSGGEIPAMAVIDSVVRLIPGAISDIESATTDSFHSGILDHPHYTRPEVFRDMQVPKILLSGNHAEIEKWRKKEAIEKTKERRADLFTEENNI